MDIKRLLDDLDVIHEFNKSDFEKQSPTFINTLVSQTDKAVCREDGLWIPKSVLRCDFDVNLYVANWFVRKSL